MDVSTRYDEVVAKNPGLKKVPLVGIIKEVAPTKQAETDEKLGVGEFQSKYVSLSCRHEIFCHALLLGCLSVRIGKAETPLNRFSTRGEYPG